MKCKVTGSPSPEKYWEKDGIIVHKCIERYQQECYLNITEAKYPDHNGVFICVANNSLAEANKSVTIQVQGNIRLDFFRL